MFCIVYTFVLLLIIYVSVLTFEEDWSANIATHCSLLVFQMFWCCNVIIFLDSEYFIQ
jgi:hypothetical protein